MALKISERLRASIIRGALFIAPLGLSIFILKFAYNMIESAFGEATAQIVRWVLPAAWLTGPFAGGNIPGLSLVAVLLVLWLIGAIAAWHFGRLSLGLLDRLLLRLPVVRILYSTLRKLFDAFGEPGGKPRFQKVVFVEWSGARTIGLVTNEIAEGDENRYVIFVPFMPNPTCGVIIVSKASEVEEAGMSVEEALKFGLSLGVLAPSTVRWDKV